MFSYYLSTLQFIWTQCWGSVIFWYGSGSSDKYLWLTDPDSDADLGWPKSYGSGSGCGTLVKSQEEVTKQKKFKFFFLFLLDMEGSGAGSVLLTSGSGSNPGGPKTYGSGSWCVSGSPTMFELKKTESQNIWSASGLIDLWFAGRKWWKGSPAPRALRSPPCGTSMPSLLHSRMEPHSGEAFLRKGSRVEVTKKENSIS